MTNPTWPTADPDKEQTPIYDKVKETLRKKREEEKK